MDTNAHQSLEDRIVEFAADALSFLLLREQDFVGQSPQLVLAGLEGLLQRFAPDNFQLQLSIRGGHYLKAEPVGLGDFARGNVHQGGATFLTIAKALGFDVHESDQFALAGKLKITGLFGLDRKNLSEKGVESGTAIGGNQPPKRQPHQTGTFDSYQRCAGQVGLKDGARWREGKITAWSEIVEVGVIVQRRFQFIPGFTQLGVLHLQLNLMNLQFVEQPFGFGAGLRRAR